MGKGFIVLNKDGAVTSTIVWGGDNPPEHCPLEISEGGSSQRLNVEAAQTIQALAKGGQRTLRIKNGEVIIDGTPIARIIEEDLELYV